MSDYAKAAARFARDTAEHEMTIVHDEGLYRHIRFRRPTTGMYWFDLITVPGALIFNGDGESYVFRRIDDMFAFFRRQQINPHYWHEKVTSHRDRIMRYDEELFVRTVRERVAEDIRDGYAPRGIGVAIKDWLDDLRFDGVIYNECEAHRALSEFAFYGEDELGNKRKRYEFTDTWEWSFRDYDWWFLWACHAIVWGIAQYDKAKVPAEAVTS